MNFKSCFLSLVLYSSSIAQSSSLQVAPALQNTLEHLDTEGEYLSINNAEGDLQSFAEIIDIFLSPLHKQEAIPAKLSATNLLDVSGLNDAHTIGSSSKKVAPNSYINKLFIDTRGSDKGLLSIIGNQPQTWQAAAYAPSNADLIAETTLDLRQLPQLMKQVAKLLPNDQQQEALAILEQELPLENLTVASALAQTQLRVSTVVRLDHNKSWSPERGVELPAIEAGLRIDGLVNLIWPMVKEELANGAALKEEGDTLIFSNLGELASPWGNLFPVISVNLKANQLWIVMSEEFLQELQSSENAKLKTSSIYQKTCTLLPSSGATHCYVSPQVSQLLIKVLNSIAPTDSDSIDTEALISYLDSKLAKDRGIAWAMTHDKKGLLMVSNSPIASKGGNLFTQLSTISGLSAMSYGPIIKNLKRANETKTIIQFRQLYMHCLEYSLDNDGNFPENIALLLAANNSIDPATLTINVDGLNLPVGYVTGLKTTSPARSIILYSPKNETGTRIVARIDGSITVVSEELFQYQLHE